MSLHDAIMNLPIPDSTDIGEPSLIYKLGHRDARHDAAELTIAFDVERDRLKAVNAELLAALKKLLNFPNKSHFNGESYAEEHGEVIRECLAAIAKATGGQQCKA